MPYSINNLRLKNFKCFDNKKFYKFSFDRNKNPIILSGPNGYGKTTFFDAIELIFKQDITRIETSIEHSRTNLKKNILINESNKDGYLILELINENNNIITIIAKIDHMVKKIQYKESIQYFVVEKSIETDNLEDFLKGSIDWKSSLKDFEVIEYSFDHYNVFYYVSQSESTHFLKTSINQRKDSMNVLLNTEKIDEIISYIEDELIGKSRTSKNKVVNDEIEKLKQNIYNKTNIFKNKKKENDFIFDKVEYQELLNYPDRIELLNWDKKNIFEDKDSKININKITKIIFSLHKFAINFSDYKKYLFNEKIKSYLNNSTIMEDAEEFIQYFDNGELNIPKIKEQIDHWRYFSKIYNHSVFFREDFKTDSFNKDDFIKLKESDENIIKVNIDEISSLVNDINEVKKELSSKQKIINELNDSRRNLNEVKNKYDPDSGKCPYCNHSYSSAEELLESYNNLTEILSTEKSEKSIKLQNLVSKLENKLKFEFDEIMNKIKDIDEDEKDKIDKKILKYQNFIEKSVRIDAVKSVYNVLNKSSDWNNTNIKKKEIEKILNESIEQYDNLAFENEMEDYNFNDIYREYKPFFKIKQSKLLNFEYIDNKIKYLEYKSNLGENEEINTLKEEIKNEMIKLRKIESAREKVDKLKRIYNDAIKDYKNEILKKLRVPLLIYTGKILQDYQNGLGVFVNKDEMRFVSNGDAKHDILNTFSSGQLSGFVLAFLFSMNKQYIKENDDIGFILIDDPVQTMDDINIASFIEVLRNDFSDKQIILSTHETDKENYILYKFLKYNLTGQSFNVKNEFYS